MTTVRLQERSVFAVIILITGEQVKQSTTKLQPPSRWRLAQVATDLNQIFVIQTWGTKICIQQITATCSPVLSVRVTSSLCRGLKLITQNFFYAAWHPFTLPRFLRQRVQPREVIQCLPQQ